MGYGVGMGLGVGSWGLGLRGEGVVRGLVMCVWGGGDWMNV